MNINKKFLLKIRDETLQRRLSLRFLPSWNKCFGMIICRVYDSWFDDKEKHEYMLNNAINDAVKYIAEDFVKRSNLNCSEYYKANHEMTILLKNNKIHIKRRI